MLGNNKRETKTNLYYYFSATMYNGSPKLFLVYDSDNKGNDLTQ